MMIHRYFTLQIKLLIGLGEEESWRGNIEEICIAFRF